MYAPLSASYQWSILNNNNAVTNRIVQLITEGQHVQLEHIPTAALAIKNRLKSPIIGKMMDAIKEGRLVMIYAPEIRVPLYLPFVLSMNENGVPVGYVFLNNLDASGSLETEINLSARKLMVSLESCYCALTFTTLGNASKLHSTAVLRAGSAIYSSMVSECINRKHSTKLDPLVFNSILYLASEYYVGTMIGCFGTLNEESLRNYCLYNCKTTDYYMLERVVSQFTQEDFKNIAAFIQKLTSVEELSKRLGRLTVSNFLESMINIYDATIMLGIENFNYFLFNIIAVKESTYQNNYQVLKNIVGDHGKKLYADIINTVMNA